MPSWPASASSRSRSGPAPTMPRRTPRTAESRERREAEVEVLLLREPRDDQHQRVGGPGAEPAAHLLAAHAAREEPDVDRARQHDDARRDAELAQMALHRGIRDRDGARGVRVDAREPHDRAARHARFERYVMRVILEPRVIGKDERRAIAARGANRHPAGDER